MCASRDGRSHRGKKSCLISWSWNYRWLCDAMWVLCPKPRSSVRAMDTLNCLAVSPVTTLCFKIYLCVCGSLNRYDPQRLMCLNVWPIKSGTIKECSLVGVGVACSEGVCHCAGRF